MKGIVKWYNDAKGHGVIETENDEDECFVEFTEICVDGFQTLESGERVEFEIERSEGRRIRAKNVEPVDRNSSRPLGPERFV